MSFAENLRKSRNKKDLTQEKLAELLEVSRQAVSKWEQGSGYPEIEKLLLIAKELEISIDWLFTEELAKKDNTQVRILPGMVTGLETFASAINSLMDQSISTTDN